MDWEIVGDDIIDRVQRSVQPLDDAYWEVYKAINTLNNLRVDLEHIIDAKYQAERPTYPLPEQKKGVTKAIELYLKGIPPLSRYGDVVSEYVTSGRAAVHYLIDKDTLVVWIPCIPITDATVHERKLIWGYTEDDALDVIRAVPDDAAVEIVSYSCAPEGIGIRLRRKGSN